MVGEDVDVHLATHPRRTRSTHAIDFARRLLRTVVFRSTRREQLVEAGLRLFEIVKEPCVTGRARATPPRTVVHGERLTRR